MLKGHTMQHSGHTDQHELMVEIYPKSQVRAVGKVNITYEIELEQQLKPINVMERAFVSNQTAVLVVRINNIGQ